MHRTYDCPAKGKAVPLESLLTAAQEGDRTAQYMIVIQFENLIRKLLKAEKNPLDQEDLRQDLTVGILEAIRRYRGNKKRFPGYVKQSLFFVTGTYIRRQRQQALLRKRLASRALPVIYYPVYPGLEIDSIRERNMRLLQAFRQLSPEERKIISYRLKPVPLSWRDIARKMGQSHNRIYWKYLQTLQKMRACCGSKNNF